MKRLPTMLAAAAFLAAFLLTQPTFAKDVVSISGAVKTDDGKPVPAVTVVVSYYGDRVAMSFSMRDRGEASATSDARGGFVLELPRTASSMSIRVETRPESPFRLLNLRSPVDDFRELADIAGPLRIDVEMTAGDQVFWGKVTDADGKPVKDASITIGREAVRSQMGRGVTESLTATTDAKGAFRFGHLLAGAWGIDSVVPPRGTGLVPFPQMWRGHGGVRVPGKEADGKTFELVSGASIRGRVIDENGKAVAGAKVSASRAPAAIEGPTVYQRAGNFGDSTATDAQGRYTLEGLTDETYQVSASSADDADFAPGAGVTGLRCEAGKTIDAGDIVLLKGGTLEGRVTSADGKPVSGAVVYFGQHTVETDAKGAYRFDRLATGLASLRVVPPEGSKWAARTIEMVPCLSKVTLRRDCTLEEGGTIAGLVTDEAGKPLAGVTVSASFSGYHHVTHTGVDGRYELMGLVESTGTDYRGRPQRYGLSASTPADSSLMSAGEQIDVKLGEKTGRDFILKPGATISGKVTDTKGKPVADARIAVYKEVGRGGRSYYGNAGPGPGRGLRTAADGTFIVRKLPADTLNVSASPPDDVNLLEAARRGVTCRSGDSTDVKLTLSAGGEVTGTVTNPAGKPVLGAQVTLSGKTNAQRLGWNRQLRPADTDAKGAFRFVGLPGGGYNVNTVIYDGIHVAAPETVEVQTGKTASVNVRVVKGGFIEVTATDPDGKPLENGSVRASSVERGRAGAYGSVKSGRAVIGPLLPGTYALQVSAYATKERTFTPATIADVEVGEGGRVTRSVQLEEGPKPAPRRTPTRGGAPTGNVN